MKNLQRLLNIFTMLLVCQSVTTQEASPWAVNIINRNVYVQGDHTIAQVNDWQSAGIQSIWLNSFFYSDISRSLLYGNMLYYFDENHQYNKAVQLFSDPEITSIPYYRINKKGDRIAVVIEKNRFSFFLELFKKEENGNFSLYREIKPEGFFISIPDISNDGDTILWSGEVGNDGYSKLFVLKNASDPSSQPVELGFVRNMGEVCLSGDGNWAYAFAWDARDPSDFNAEQSENVTLYSHYEDGVWTESKPLIIDNVLLRWPVFDTNFDSRFLECAGGIVERKGELFTKRYGIKPPRDGIIDSKMSEDGKSVIYMAIDNPNLDYHFPEYYNRRSDVLVIAVHENENDEFATNYIVDEGYSMHFAYSKLTDTILWTAYDEDQTDWTKVQDWQEVK